jgi:hypothetical protein
MNILTNTDFTGIYAIPDSNESNVIELLNDFITEYEEFYGIYFCGFDLWYNFKNGLDAVTVEQKWIDLRDGKAYQIDSVYKRFRGLKKMLLAFVWYTYVRELQSEITGIGVRSVGSENSQKVTDAQKIIERYNAGVDIFNEGVEFVNNYSELYPNFDYSTLEKFNFIGA